LAAVTTTPATPKQPTTVNSTLNVAGGGEFSVFEQFDGSLQAAGDNSSGQLGIGVAGGQANSAVVSDNNATGFTGIAAGLSHALATQQNGTLWSWGLNADGQLGDGTTTARASAVPIQGTYAPAAPSAPTNVAASAGDGQAIVTWTAAASGQPVQDYVIRVYQSGSSYTIDTGSANTTYTVGGLTNNSTYLFSVTAISCIGQGLESARSNAITVGLPGPPTNAAAHPGNYSATVTWSAPANPVAISSYTVTPYAGTSAGTPVITGGSATSANFYGLSAGTTYTFQIYATNSVGNSAPATTNPVTPTVPSIGPHLYVEEQNCCSSSTNYGFVSQTNVPAMSQWTVEGYLFDDFINASFSNAYFGLLSGTPNQPGAAVAGIHMEGCCDGPWFVWPGSTNQCRLPDTNGPPVAAESPTPAHFALSYDGATVRGFINGAIVCSIPTASAAVPASPAGFLNQHMLYNWSMDEVRVSNVARYTANFSPTAQYPVDANTLAQYDFHDYGIAKLPPMTTTQDGAVYTVHGVFGDTTAHNNSLQEIGWGTCGFCATSMFYPYTLSQGVSADEVTGGGSPWICSCTRGETKYPVNTGTGEFWHTFDDLSIPGRGVSLDLSQTYSSHLASQAGPMGYGWTTSYSRGLSVDGSGNVTVQAGNGAKVVFQPGGAGTYSAPSHVLATLVRNGDGTFTFTDKQKTVDLFDASGRLIKETDRNGYATNLAYNASGLATVTDPAGRTLSFTYANGLIQTVTDSGGRSVGLTYDANNNLTQLTDVGGGHTKFTYDGNHRLLTMRDPNCSAAAGCAGVTNVYDSSNRITQQTDDLGRITKFAYSGSSTTITDPNGNQTVDEYRNGVLVSTTRGSGSAQQATWSYEYDPTSLGQIQVTDPNGHTTKTTRDSQANILTQTDGLNRTATYTYNSFSEVLTATDPLSTTTTNTYDTRGNLTSVARPLTGTGTTQTTSFTYGDSSHPGDRS
jgi:YD repeat-containing protein